MRSRRSYENIMAEGLKLILLFTAFRVLICYQNFAEISPLSSACWTSVMYSSYTSQCFYAMNATIPESTVEEIFFDMNHEYPGVFNPLYILRNLTMLHDEVNYSMGSMQLQNGSSILIYALDLPKAYSNFQSGDDGSSLVYRSFCDFKRLMVPTQECFLHELAQASKDDIASCTAEEIASLGNMITTSQLQYQFYHQFCLQLFNCSSQPIRDCLGDQWSQSPGMTPTMTACAIAANFNDEFSLCVMSRVADCEMSVHLAYGTLISVITNRLGVFSSSSTPHLESCHSLLTDCTQTELRRVDEITEGCLYDLYFYEINSGEPSALQLLVAGLRIADDQLDAAAGWCRELFGAQLCLRVHLGSSSCDRNWLSVFAALTDRITETCNGVIEMTERTTPTPAADGSSISTSGDQVTESADHDSARLDNAAASSKPVVIMSAIAILLICSHYR